MSYYHTARAHVKELKHATEQNKRKAERRAEMEHIKNEQPLNYLRIDGQPCKLIRSEESYRAIERTEGMIPYNGQEDNLIDRFDGRALLDFYRDPAASRRPKSEEELELQELVTFESFRDLVPLLQTGLPENKGIVLAQQTNVELRASARATAAAEAGGSRPGPGTSSRADGASYAAVGFSYTSTGLSRDSDSSDESSSGDEDDRDQAAQQQDRAADDLAERLGITGFSGTLRRAVQLEEDEAEGRKPRKKRLLSRKKAAERARRMAGQGKGPIADRARAAKWPGDGIVIGGAPRPGYARRSSPTYDPYRDDGSASSGSSRSRSRSPRARGHGRSEYITEFKVGKAHRAVGGGVSSSALGPDSRSAVYLDAMPSRADPAVDGGPVSLPAAAVTLKGVRREDSWSTEPSKRDWQSDRDRQRDRDRPAASSRPAKPAVAAPAAKETPMERMKRLRAAQLNRTFQGQVLTAAQKKSVEERERQALVSRERHARAYSPARSYSPGRNRSRSRLFAPLSLQAGSGLVGTSQVLTPLYHWYLSSGLGGGSLQPAGLVSCCARVQCADNRGVCTTGAEAPTGTELAVGLMGIVYSRILRSAEASCHCQAAASVSVVLQPSCSSSVNSQSLAG